MAGLTARGAKLLLTEDEDFGGMVFGHGLTGPAIVFMRYEQPQYQTVEPNLLFAVGHFYQQAGYFFVTVTPEKIRSREI